MSFITHAGKIISVSQTDRGAGGTIHNPYFVNAIQIVLEST